MSLGHSFCLLIAYSDILSSSLRVFYLFKICLYYLLNNRNFPCICIMCYRYFETLQMCGDVIGSGL